MTLAVVVAAFFVGAIPFGLLVSRTFFRRDIRSEGSGNIGAANALRTMGAKAGMAVLALDALKGAVAVVAGNAIGGAPLGAASGFAAVAGHCFSPFLRFRGGKGVATYLGATIALAPPAAAAFALVWIATAACAQIASVASLIATIATVPVLWYVLRETGLVYGACTAALIVVMHRGNLARLRAGTENRLTFRKSAP